MAKTLTFFNKIGEQMNDFMTALLKANEGRITVNAEVLLENPQYDDNEKTKSYSPYLIAEIRYEEGRKENGEYIPGRIMVYQPDDEQGVDFGHFDIAEQQNLINAATKEAENEARLEFFSITSVARDDVKQAGFDSSELTDEQMERLADKMADAYVENGFWIDLPIIAEDLGFPKEKERYVMGHSQAEDKDMVVYAHCLEDEIETEDDE